MHVVGISVDIPSSGRPAVRVVAIDDGSGVGVITKNYDFTGEPVPLPVQLHDAAESVRSRLHSLKPDRVIVRRADRPPRPSGAEGPKLRLLMEGAVVSAARSVIVDTRLGTGKEVGAWHGTNKAAVEAQALSLLRTSGLRDTYVEAVAAALAGLVI